MKRSNYRTGLKHLTLLGRLNGPDIILPIPTGGSFEIFMHQRASCVLPMLIQPAKMIL